MKKKRAYTVMLPFTLSFALFIMNNSWGQNLSQKEIITIDFTSKQEAIQKKNIVFTDKGLTYKTIKSSGTFISPKQKVPINNIEPFLSFFIGAKVDNFNHNGNIIFSVRASHNGKQWEEWINLEEDDHSEELESFFSGNLIYFDKNIRYIQYKISISNDNKGASIQKLFLNFFSPGMSNLMQLHDNKSRDAVTAVACPCPQPNYNTRTQWGCPDGQSPSCNPPSYTIVTHLIVHHEAGSNTSANWAARVLSIWNYHTTPVSSGGKGFCDIGYNWLIDPNGVVYEGRGGGNNVKGAHFTATASCAGANSGTMGTCLLGDYTSISPTQAAYNSLTKLLAWKSCNSGINPTSASYHSSSGLTLSNISGHRDGSGGSCTACPGNVLHSQLAALRTDVNNLINSPNCSGTSVNPANLLVIPMGCPNDGVTLSWTNAGSGWYVDVSDDPSFSYFWNKNVTNLTSIICPGGFIHNSIPNNYLSFKPLITYYWRIRNGASHTNGNNFTTPVCIYTTVDCSNTFNDTGGPSSPYSDNEDYTTVIQPGNASSVTMTFTSFDLELNFDSLWIYDGMPNTTLIGAYTGTNNPGIVTANSGVMSLHFKSDPFINNAGWTATWTCMQATAVNEFATYGLQFTVYPNPFSSSATIYYQLTTDASVQINLIDVLGRERMIYENESASAGNYIIPIHTDELGLAKGMYVLKIDINAKNATIKLVNR